MRPSVSRRLLQPLICPRCQFSERAASKRLCRSSQRRFLSTIQPTSQDHSAFAYLTNRRIVRLDGPDAKDFLHNLLPAKILNLEDATRPIYTAFLSAQGRILHDVFVYPPHTNEKAEEWLVEVDAEGASDLLKHLRKHKLRAKFKLEAIPEEEIAVLYTWPEVRLQLQKTSETTLAGGNDGRPGMGSRWLCNPNSNVPLLEALDIAGAESTTFPSYTLHRMSLGIAEGTNEMPPGASLPQESNLDLYANSIDFHKGCYLGQELTIRTHHTGVVRKRILPCQIYHADSTPDFASQQMPQYDANSATNLTLPLAGSNIAKVSSKPGKGRSTGKWLGGVGNVGLAICRLEMMTDIQLTADRSNFDPSERYVIRWNVATDETTESTGIDQNVMIQPFVPEWMRNGIEERLRRKEKKARKRQEDEEDYEE